MSHSETLKLLIPLPLGDAHDKDITIEGAHLDQAGERGDKLLLELFADTTLEVLEAWEHAYATAPFFDDPLLVRHNRIVQKMSELGRLDRAYFIQIAAAIGYNIILEELHPFMPGWSGAGDELGDNDSNWCWRIYYTDTSAYIFRAGSSAAGENLSYSYGSTMQEIINNLKPADTFVEFIEA